MQGDFLMASISTQQKKEKKWLQTYRQHGYYVQLATIATFAIGMYIHVTRLFLGDDLLLKYVYISTFDMLFVLPMAYAAVAELLSWKQVIHPSRRHRFIWGVIVFYVTASVFLHASTYLTHSTNYLRFFPLWWTIWFLIVTPVMIVFTWRLQLKEQD
jgi:hypothetical protein